MLKMVRTKLTSAEIVLEGISIVYLEAILSSACETALILIERDIENFLRGLFHGLINLLTQSTMMSPFSQSPSTPLFFSF